ncbi:peptidase MA family metallohydrolase, partial [Candidatus Marinimicrobia bacterium]|nr:peptidase MA family metallohydrolase [Candidatus Neomarinimicrobiota bacterium]
MNRFVYYILLIQSTLLAQFGQNILQYEKFDWQYIQTQYFDIYFYDIGLENRDFLKYESNEAYKKMSSYLDWNLKDRYTIILHNSHNDFQQTNVIDMYMQEGIGGVTELYKNRVVIPFDGSLSDLKHVLHHELVHLFINDMLYGGSVRNMIYSNVRQIPLWLNEGLAEYLSEKWSSNSEMWIRDITNNSGNLPNFNQLNGYLAYRGGQSVWQFMTEKWGEEIISQLFWEIKKTGSTNKAFEKALGLDADGLLKLWHNYLKDSYWPDIKNRKKISQISETLINHKDLKNSYNIAPYISPTGEKFTIYSNKDGRMDIYLVSTNDGKFLRKVIDGEETSKFEELHILKPGVSWSADGKKIVFAAKSGKSDALYIFDLKTNKTLEYRLGLEGIFQPVWNPKINSSEVAFIGNNGLQSDIYIYNFEDDDLINLTNDWFSESDPSWSNNGEYLYFISNRNEYSFTNGGLSFSSLSESFDVTQNDIYTLNLQNRKINRVTDTPWNESLPMELKNNRGMIFLSDESGINNLYVSDFNENFSITNVSTGITQFSIDRENRQILFCGLEEGGFNIYSITEPLRLLDKNIVPPEANWLSLDLNYNNQINQINKDTSTQNNYKNNYSNFVFNSIDSSKISKLEPIKEVKKDSDDRV